MTSHRGNENPFGLGLSDVGLMDNSPEADAISILQRVRDGLANLPADSSSDEGEAA